MHKSLQKVYVGIDVAKHKLSLNTGKSGSWEIPNRIPSIRKNLNSIQGSLPDGHTLHVCFEATGCYPRKIRQYCTEAGIPFSTLNPNRVRQFAQGLSMLAKTDAIDAKAIQIFSENKKPMPDMILSADQEQMRELANLRRILVTTDTRIRGFLESSSTSAVRQEAKKMLRSIENRQSYVDKQLLCFRDNDPKRKAVCDELVKIVGVGDITALQVLAFVPELGTLGRRRATALAGLAPYAYETGTYIGPRRIKGGRFNLRTTLYMSSLSASQHNAVLKKVYAKKLKEGKSKKVALICVMRKLFIHMDRVAAQAIADYEAGIQAT